ncbi:hypothetical protein [Corynebacterium phoceense]|uniref:hypothetical protein n=1 Tax=Corynebacterium phoceense TaxID=1686286 RepID=UPI00211C6472|nr:hypothetical protein [Corynebacterium phoceense]MCQ9346011.1 hypothetical protein [Corynebacterium phoceense]
MATKIPSEVVLDGYSLAEQHQIDHIFLTEGSPFSLLAIVGLVLIAIAGWRFRWLLIPGVLLALHRLWWIPVLAYRLFDDPAAAGYAAQYYPLYWLPQTLALIAAAVVLYLVGSLARRMNRR